MKNTPGGSEERGEEDDGVGGMYEYAIPLDDDDDYDDGSESFARMNPRFRREALAAERLSVRLLAIDDDDEEAEDKILRESLALGGDDDKVGGAVLPGMPPISRQFSAPQLAPTRRFTASRQYASSAGLIGLVYLEDAEELEPPEEKAKRRVWTMVAIAVAGLCCVGAALFIGVKFVGPPNVPVGPYQLVERQEGMEFFNYYTFYEGRDSVGSNGYLNYVNMAKAQERGIVNVSMEADILDVYRAAEDEKKNKTAAGERHLQQEPQQHKNTTKTEPFIYMGSKATVAGPRDSIRLEGIRRFDRGLFIIDLRHMPAGCGVWPAFWLTDEANWPINGEIDIVEGVNYQSEAKTALHSTNGCSMNDIPLGTMTGTWDTAQVSACGSLSLFCFSKMRMLPCSLSPFPPILFEYQPRVSPMPRPASRT